MMLIESTPFVFGVIFDERSLFSVSICLSVASCWDCLVGLRRQPEDWHGAICSSIWWQSPLLDADCRDLCELQ